jgi:hypothetical protein
MRAYWELFVQEPRCRDHEVPFRAFPGIISARTLQPDRSKLSAWFSVGECCSMVWRRKPKNRVLIHSDQGSQFTSIDWASFLKHHDLEHSMSRRGNCHDNAVAESVFNLLKRERILA